MKDKIKKELLDWQTDADILDSKDKKMRVESEKYGYIEIENGEVLTMNFSDFFMRGTMEIPKIKHIIITTDDKYGPFGAKGVGEIIGNPVPAAVANAIYDAIGIRLKELPMNPEKILLATERTL